MSENLNSNENMKKYLGDFFDKCDNDKMGYVQAKYLAKALSGYLCHHSEISVETLFRLLDPRGENIRVNEDIFVKKAFIWLKAVKAMNGEKLQSKPKLQIGFRSVNEERTIEKSEVDRMTRLRKFISVNLVILF